MGWQKNWYNPFFFWINVILGIMGLIESDWLPSLTFSSWKQDWTYVDFIDSAKALVEIFKAQGSFLPSLCHPKSLPSHFFLTFRFRG